MDGRFLTRWGSTRPGFTQTPDFATGSFWGPKHTGSLTQRGLFNRERASLGGVARRDRRHRVCGALALAGLRVAPQELPCRKSLFRNGI